MTDQSTPVPSPPYPSAATQHGQSYLPGMGHDWLLPLYDPSRERWAWPPPTGD